MGDMTELFGHISKLLKKVQGARNKNQEAATQKSKKINSGYTLCPVFFLRLVPFLLYLNDGMGMVKSRDRSIKGPG